jgi:hypothetical protein
VRCACCRASGPWTARRPSLRLSVLINCAWRALGPSTRDCGRLSSTGAGLSRDVRAGRVGSQRGDHASLAKCRRGTRRVGSAHWARGERDNGPWARGPMGSVGAQRQPGPDSPAGLVRTGSAVRDSRARPGHAASRVCGFQRQAQDKQRTSNAPSTPAHCQADTKCRLHTSPRARPLTALASCLAAPCSGRISSRSARDSHPPSSSSSSDGPRGPQQVLLRGQQRPQAAARLGFGVRNASRSPTLADPARPRPSAHERPPAMPQGAGSQAVDAHLAGAHVSAAAASARSARTNQRAPPLPRARAHAPQHRPQVEEPAPACCLPRPGPSQPARHRALPGGGLAALSAGAPANMPTR